MNSSWKFAYLSLAVLLAGNTVASADPRPELSWTLSQRTRAETLDGQFRSGRSGSDQIVLFRTGLRVDARVDRYTLSGELLDARQTLGDEGTPLSASLINPLDVLQAKLAIRLDGRLGAGSRSTLEAGRFTMDIGDRRLVARNRFRNTINAFTGVNWRWQRDGQSVQAFYVLPVRRRINGDPLDNRGKSDEEDGRQVFWGLGAASAFGDAGDRGEWFLFRLKEADGPSVSTRDRALYTAGFRFLREPDRRAWDYEIQSVYQWGEARASTSSADVRALDVKAHFLHLEAGYSFDAAWSPRLIAQFDYASGDKRPDDGQYNRFDTLFGARRFDFGPTSLYGPFARANLRSPGLRLALTPSARIDSFVALRQYWLADADDAWTTAGLRNADGASRTELGTQIEARVRWNPIPKTLRIDTGVAHLFAGDFMNAAGKTDATFAYFALSLSFTR